MKKKATALIAMMLAIATVMSISLTACGNPSAENTAPSTQPPQTQTPASETPSEPANTGGEDEASPYDIFAYDLPSGYKKPTDNPGEIHEENYTTYLYDNDGNKGEEIEATLYVYTPAGYDASKQYNIIYLMHGIGDEEGYWLGAGPYAEGGEKYNKATAKYTTNVFEHMIADGRCDEAILVTPTFMNQFSDDEDDPNYVYADDSTTKLVRMSYQFKNDILPFVEAKYSTYAGSDVSDPH